MEDHEKIRCIRESAGLTVHEAAALVYTSHQTWWRWERPPDRYGGPMPLPLFELFMLKIGAASLLRDQPGMIGDFKRRRFGAPTYQVAYENICGMSPATQPQSQSTQPQSQSTQPQEIDNDRNDSHTDDLSDV